MITVRYTGKQEVVIGYKNVLPGETFSIAPGLLPALIAEHGDVFGVPGQAQEAPQPTEQEAAKATSRRGRKGA
jgi:hypothetical protein